MNLRQKLGSVLALLLISAGAQATTITAGYTVDANKTDPGLVIGNADVASNPFTFDLNPGQSTGFFDLFDIWTDETDVGADDQMSRPIAVNFDFTQPQTGTTTVGGETLGFSLFGILEKGLLTWNGPAEFSFGPLGDGLIQVILTDARFNTGLFGLDEGRANGATVRAELTLLQDATTVAEPGVIALFAIALLGLLMATRRRRAGFDRAA